MKFSTFSAVVMAVLVAVFSSGCAMSVGTTGHVKHAQEMSSKKDEAARRAERQREARLYAGAQAMPMAPVAVQPMTGMPMNGVVSFGPPLPPSNVAQLHRPMPGCSKPFAIAFRNDTSYFIEVQVNGMQLRVFGSQGELPPFIPPGETVYSCLENLGQNQITGTAYSNRGGELKAVERFNADRRFTPSTAYNRGLQEFPITEKTLRWN